MMSAEMKQNSSHTATTSAETVEVDTGAIDIDMDLLKKERQRDISDSTGPTRSHSEKWTGLNDSAKTGTELDGKSNHEGSDHSRSSHRRGRMPRRNSNSSTQSFGSVGSAGSRGSKGSKGSSKRRGVTKRRSWKKPKDKPKRPLSAYNIFFEHTRSRIVEGLPAQGTTEETIASIESIVANSTETRRNRKTHGQISFGNLARTIANQWKTIDKNEGALFDHYASVEMKRYRRDVSSWKKKNKERETLSISSRKELPNFSGRSSTRNAFPQVQAIEKAVRDEMKRLRKKDTYPTSSRKGLPNFSGRSSTRKAIPQAMMIGDKPDGTCPMPLVDPSTSTYSLHNEWSEGAESPTR